MEPIARTAAATTTTAAGSVHISQEQFVSWRRQKVAADGAVVCGPVCSPPPPPAPSIGAQVKE